MVMRPLALPLLLVLAACAGGDGPAQSVVAASPPVASSPLASPRAGVPPELWAACGKPGSTVEVEAVPVTVRHADCDLSGVTLMHAGVGMAVPKPGEGGAGFFEAPPGGSSRSASVSRDEATKDVTFSVTR